MQLAPRSVRPTPQHLQHCVRSSIKGGTIGVGVLCLLLSGSSTSSGQNLHQTTETASSSVASGEASKQVGHIRELISRMTLEEKASQMIDHAPAIPRLGIPAYDWWNEGLHGVARAGAATVFPQAIGLAATWDTALIKEVGGDVVAEGREKRAEVVAGKSELPYRGLTFWSPNINIFRDPRWGRGQETYGEDPFLTATMGVAFIRGIQGPDPLHPQAIATPKHYAVHSGPEPLRHVFDAKISPHDLEDTYLPAFRAAIVEGGAGSVMCSYNAVNGSPACGSDALLGKSLREQWRFQGYVTSDCGAIKDLAEGHKTVQSIAEAAAYAVKAGTDLDCGKEYLQLPDAVAKGFITEREINRSVERLFIARSSLGLLDAVEVTPAKAAEVEVDSKAHRALALKAAEESLVLLKNSEAALPLSPAIHKIAVIGPGADELDVLEGNYNGTPTSVTTVLAGIQEQWQGKAEVSFAPGSSLARGISLTIPAYVLEQPRSSGKAGVSAEYYDNPEFKGKPYAIRVDDHINFDWRERSPIAGLPSRGYSVRWNTNLLPYFSGTVRVGIDRGHCWDCKASDPATFYVNGKAVASDPGTGRDGVQSMYKLRLEKGKPVSLRIEYSNSSGDAAIRLVWFPPADALKAEAVEIAKRADAVIMVLGLSPGLEGEEMPISVEGFKGGDRTRLDLPATQTTLYREILATGKPVHVVLMNGSPLAIADIDKSAASVLEAWYPGEEGGHAIAEALSGHYSPGGRLPLTFYSSVTDLPPFVDYSMAKRTYRYFAGKPLYPFGYGLSFTRFDYDCVECHLSPNNVDGSQIRVRVRNAGHVDGDEVVQVYATAPQTPNAPLKSLVAFQRIHLAAGESREVSLALTARALSVASEDGSRSVVGGVYSLWIGGGQPGTGAAGVAGEIKVATPVGLPR